MPQWSQFCLASNKRPCGMKCMSLVYLGLHLFGLLQAGSKWLLTEWPESRHPVTDITFGAFATKRSKKGSSSFATSVGLSTSPHAANRCSWNFMLGVLKIPNTYQLLKNYTLLTGCFLPGECGLGVKLTTYIYMWQIKNAWSYTSTVPYVSQDKYLTKRSDKFITQEYTYFRCFRTVNARKVTLMSEIVELSHVLSWK